jgi:hypothetical protein
MAARPPFYGLCCRGCGGLLVPPVDPTAVHVKCPSCDVDNVLAPELIQARQRQYDSQQLAVERARQVEQQRLMQQRVANAKRAASRRTAITLVVVVGVFLLLPVLGIASLFAFGFFFGKTAMHSLQEAQDPERNGMPSILGEIRSKHAQGCQRVMIPPEIRFGGGGRLRLILDANGPCIHLLGATTAKSAQLAIEQSSQHPLWGTLPDPAPNFDYRLCPTVSAGYEFSVRSSNNAPFTIAAVACPRTVAEGLVRSTAGDPMTTGLTELRDWADGFRGKGCRPTSAEPAAWKGPQVIDVESTNGGPCFNLLAVSHFADAPLAVKLMSSAGKSLAEPAPATRIHVEYCPNETGRHRVEITPSTKDHYATASFDCPRQRRAMAPRPTPLVVR